MSQTLSTRSWLTYSVIYLGVDMWELLIIAALPVCFMIVLALFNPVRLEDLDTERAKRKFARMQMEHELKLLELRMKYESQGQPRSHHQSEFHHYDGARQYQRQICPN